MPDNLTLTALPAQPLLTATLARRAAEYHQLRAARTLDTWDQTEERMAAIIMLVPEGQRRAFHAMVDEIEDTRHAI